MFRLRRAVLADISCFESIDEAADRMFPAGRLPKAEDETPLSDYLPSLEQGWLRVAEAAGSVVGYIWCIAHAEALHIQQISVHPAQGRQGIGRSLMEDVIRAAAEQGVRSVTLTTFADIAWNAPFYRSAGFEDISAEGLYPHVDTALRHERALGMTQRIGMVCETDSDHLMLAHVEAMYEHNAQGQILRINDWLRRPAPLFWMGRTNGSLIWRLRSDLPTDQCAEVEDALQRMQWPEPEDATNPLVQQATVVRLLADLGIIGETASGPTFLCCEDAPAPLSTHYPTIEVTSTLQKLLNGGLEDWIPDIPHQRPFIASIENDQAVAVCASVRITDKAHAAGVETVPGFRGRGHAINAVSAWASKVRASGALAMYSTSWDNLASRAVAARMNMVEFGWELRVG